MLFEQDEPEESIITIEESGGFEQNEENPGASDHGWKDELNLAEFPIAALTDRVPNGQTTLVFEDKLERRDHPPIVRRLTIMGTVKHGLPTSTDDEVLVGLIQLTKRRSNFTNAKVPFSRYELIELLGWPQSGASYRRIEEALNRWVGVVLMYENAWWDNTAKSWVDENFHVLDNVTLYDRERRKRSAGKAGKAGAKPASGRRPKKTGTEGDPLPLSSFRWNEVIFESFQSGNLKQLDLEFYLRLRLPTTKRMFRFLDKRFYRRERLDFDLRTLACEHIGMSRSYAPTELKRRLRPALEELEQLGFLEPLDPEERYSWVARGCWRIILIRGQAATPDAPPVPTDASALIESLTSRGITPKTAAELVANHPSGRVRTKLEVFDWLVKNQDKRVGKNPAGYLVASIRSDYQAPEEFSRSAKVEEAKKEAEDGDRKAKRKVREESEKARAKDAELLARWEKLPESEREAIRAAVQAENPGLGRWKNMLEPLCLAAMEARSSKPTIKQKGLFPGPGEE
ncbi:replication initiator protein A (plasmid) [Tundrisphaera lichenicola]|uniref:replication initiator protein A n=1 Tax=Tundrisphaera lichenicola TaxID=2029860 RepID=UPI003EB91A43